MKKLIYLTVIVLTSITANSQVGIGTTTPEASLHINNINNDSIVLYVKGNDGNNKFKVAEDGTIYISEPLYNSNLEDLLAYDYSNNSIRLFDIYELKSTGLERLDQGFGNGWRLIGRNPSLFAPIGFQAVDFSNSTNSNMGASGNYSFLGSGLNNKAISNTDNNFLILGGNNNLLDQDASSNNLHGVSIVGGNNNLAFSNSYLRSLIFGDNNKFEKEARGITLGNNNNLFSDTEAHIVGNNNIVQSKNNTLIFGDNNTTTKNIFDVGILGNSNNIGMLVTSKGEHGGFAFGTNNRNESGKSFLIGNGNIARQSGHKKYSFLIGLNNYNQQAMPSFLFGNQLINRIPFNVVVGQYNEALTSSHPPTEVAYEVEDLNGAYYSVTNDPAFVVGIGYRNNDNGAILRKDGFRVYKNGKVEIRQLPNTDNSLENIYVRAADGSFALRDLNSIISSSLIKDLSTGTMDSNYLNTTYLSKPIGTNIYSPIQGKIYIKVDTNQWISYIYNVVP